MDVDGRQQLLSILGFQATVTKTGEVQASILVPAEVNRIHHWTNMGMIVPWHLGTESSGASVRIPIDIPMAA
jgi:hypothetical protein